MRELAAQPACTPAAAQENELVRQIAQSVAVALEGSNRRPSRKRLRVSSVDVEAIAEETWQLPEEKRQRAIVLSRIESARSHHASVMEYIEMRQRLIYEWAPSSTNRSSAESGAELELVGDTSARSPESNLCIICLEDMQLGARRSLEALPCSHVYHRSCIRAWSRYNRCCPIDRLSFDCDFPECNGVMP